MPVSTGSAFAPGDARLRVGDWEVERPLNRISCGATVIKLEPKAMAVLVYLADRPGQVVSRDALLSGVWPGLVVSDDSLTQVVIKLRRALGDARATPRYIQTIAKGGYRLVARVDRSGNATTPKVVPPAERSPAGRRRFDSWAAGAGIATLVIVAAAMAWVGSERGTGAPRHPALLAGTAATWAGQPVVAIRPFEGLGDDPKATLLAQGMTAELVTDLSKVFALRLLGVAGADGRQDGRPMADVQPVRYFVTGSVLRVDERLQLYVNLIDAATGEQLWSERFDRKPEAYDAIQEELGAKLLDILPAKVGEAELRQVAERDTHNLEAYGYFRRGQSALLARQREDNKTARAMFRHAIALDPVFARAYAGLALTYAADYRNQWSGDGAAALDRAFELATTAHQINPQSAETYWVLAFVCMERRQDEQALQYLQTAVRRDPAFADGYALMGGVETYVGRPADTVPLLRTAMRLNPDAGYLYFLLLGRAYLFLGDLEQARVNLEQALSRSPVNLEAHVYMAALDVTAGDKAAAAWEAEEIRSLQPGFSSRNWLATYPMTDVAQKSKLVQALDVLAL